MPSNSSLSSTSPLRYGRDGVALRRRPGTGHTESTDDAAIDYS